MKRLIHGLLLIATTLSPMARAADPGRIACNLNVFTKPERARHIELIAILKSRVIEMRDAARGYSFRYSPELLQQLAEWSVLESKCCPFIDFQLELEPQPGGAVWLRLQGDEDVREFIRTEFQPLIELAHSKGGLR
jgi:hypothetical protein